MRGEVQNIAAVPYPSRPNRAVTIFLLNLLLK